jgi:carbon storage regulator
MLILSRCKDESIIVGENVEVLIVDVRDNKVRLGITAPKDISVHRKEVYEAIQRGKTMKNHQHKRRTHESQGFKLRNNI